MSANTLQARLDKRLLWQNQAHRLEQDDLRLQPNLPLLRKWQTQRLKTSFEHFLDNPRWQPAANFFLNDLYGDADFIQRDQETAKILPKMARLLPESLLMAAIDAIELSVLSHALDMKMARVMHAHLQPLACFDAPAYQKIYCLVGLPRLRKKQIQLIINVGYQLDAVVKKQGVSGLLKASRMPARILGLQHLQGFLERGFMAFQQIGGAHEFLQQIYQQETVIAMRLMQSDPNPFAPPFT